MWLNYILMSSDNAWLYYQFCKSIYIKLFFIFQSNIILDLLVSVNVDVIKFD